MTLANQRQQHLLDVQNIDNGNNVQEMNMSASLKESLKEYPSLAKLNARLHRNETGRCYPPGSRNCMAIGYFNITSFMKEKT